MFRIKTTKNKPEKETAYVGQYSVRTKEKLFIKNPIKLLLISDTHGSYEYHRIDDHIYTTVDACVCMGDVYETELREIKKCCDDAGIPAYAIPGNHEPKTAIDKEGLINIHGKVIEINNIKIAGWGGSFKYKNRDELCMMTDEESLVFERHLSRGDILISHSNPKKNKATGTHSGLEGISVYLRSLRVPLHFFGHLHERSMKILPYMHSDINRDGSTLSICIYRAAIVEIGKKITVKYLF